MPAGRRLRSLTRLVGSCVRTCCPAIWAKRDTFCSTPRAEPEGGPRVRRSRFEEGYAVLVDVTLLLRRPIRAGDLGSETGQSPTIFPWGVGFPGLWSRSWGGVLRYSPNRPLRSGTAGTGVCQPAGGNPSGGRRPVGTVPQ